MTFGYNPLMGQKFGNRTQSIGATPIRFNEEVDVVADAPEAQMAEGPSMAMSLPSSLAGVPGSPPSPAKQGPFSLSNILKGLAGAGILGLAGSQGGLDAAGLGLSQAARGWTADRKKRQDEERDKAFRNEQRYLDAAHKQVQDLMGLDLSQSPELHGALTNYMTGFSSEKGSDQKGASAVLAAIAAHSGDIQKARDAREIMLQTEKTKAEVNARQPMEDKRMQHDLTMQGMRESGDTSRQSALFGHQLGMQKTEFEKRAEQAALDRKHQESLWKLRGADALQRTQVTGNKFGSILGDLNAPPAPGSGVMTPPPSAGPAIGQTATNKQTGQRIRWNGQSWEPIQ